MWQRVMTVLQANQASQLQALEQGQRLSPEAVAERLRASKQTPLPSSFTERHLCLNLSGENRRKLLSLMTRSHPLDTSPLCSAEEFQALFTLVCFCFKKHNLCYGYAWRPLYSRALTLEN